MIVLFAILVFRCFQLQIVEGETYLEQYTLSIQKEIVTEGTRGNIYDRNGELLAYNVMAYDVTIEDNGDYDSTAEKNKSLIETILSAIQIIEENGNSVINNFGIIIDEDGNYAFRASEGTTRLRFIADIYGKPLIDELSDEEKSITPDEMMDMLCDEKRYGVNQESYDKETVLKIINIRYEMSLKSYQKYIPTDIANNVSLETVAAIKESSNELQGVSIAEGSYRAYNDGMYFGSILGYTGAISQEEYDDYVEEGYTTYSTTDSVGKSGVEKEMDPYLQGTNGEEIIYTDAFGQVIDSVSATNSAPGNDLYLTIDSELQKVAYDVLEEKIAAILLSKLQNTLTFDNRAVGSNDEIMIPIGDVYNAFISNSIIDYKDFSDKDAGETEQAVQEIYETNQATVIDFVNNYYNDPEASSYSKLSSVNQSYIQYTVNTLLRDKGTILLKDKIDTSDEVYRQWASDESINIYTYLNYAISKNWIDTTKLEEYFDESDNSSYSDTEEIYRAIINYLNDVILTDSGFQRLIYEKLIQDGSVTGMQIALIIYEQELLPTDDGEYERLISGDLTAYDFFRLKIQNLEFTPGQLGLEPATGSVVITDVNTGDALAIVDYPGYDNNQLANEVDSEYYNYLLNSSSDPLYNHATQEKTAPGSTFKMVTAAAGLTEGVITPSTIIHCSGIFEKVFPNPKCWSHPHAHGALDVVGAIQNSCNVFFYEVGYRLSLLDRELIGTDDATGNTTSISYSSDLGISTMEQYATMLGLGETTGIEISETKPEISNTASVPSAIGQGTHNYSTVQLARYTNTVANEGTVYNLTLLDSLKDSEGNVVEEFDATVASVAETISANTWDVIHQGMEQMVDNSATFSKLEGIDIAGKTGTAQHNQYKANHGLFTGYAPTTNPEITVSVRITYGYTSSYSAEVARDITEYYFGEATKQEVITGQAGTLGEAIAGD